jgi:Amt family ammonium transporter
MNTGDVAYVLMCSVLVFLMTPGLALFYGGMVRKRHVLSIMVQSFAAIGIVTVLWVIIGYSLAFGQDYGHVIGGLNFFALQGVGIEPNPAYSSSLPQLAFFFYQMMFAIITPAVMTGSTAERLRFPAFALMITLWSLLVYIPLAHWVWGDGGWLRNLGLLDFAGGTVVEIASGVSGLVAALVVGKRHKPTESEAAPHNMPSVLLGGGLLWFGWFGFNAGSALSANGIAVIAMVTTLVAGAAGMLGWMLTEWLLFHKVTAFGAVSGIIAALVGITPAAGFVSPVSALLVGFIAGIVSYFGVSFLKNRLGYDDTLDAFGIHGLSGIWGTFATGIFASLAINNMGANGLANGGGMHQMLIQLLGIAVAFIYTGGMTFIILKVVALFTPLKATSDQQENGLDLIEHGENAYPDFEIPENLYV